MKQIQYALEQHLLQLPNLPDPAPIAWPNIEFTPNFAQHGYYLRPTYIPAQPDVVSIGIGYQRHTGIFQIDIFTPRGQSSYTANELASNLVEHFKTGTEIPIPSLNILRIVSSGVLGGTVEPDLYMLPVVIQFYMYEKL